jgi:hypothetical protein
LPNDTGNPTILQQPVATFSTKDIKLKKLTEENFINQSSWIQIIPAKAAP